MLPAPRSPGRRAPVAPPSGPERRQAVAALLRDLGAEIRPGGPPPEAPAYLPTGLLGVDRLLGGGFRRGVLSEIAGRPGSGRTALALALLATTTRAGESVAVVDAADAFDPGSAAAAGVELARVLWVRPARVRTALRSTELLLEAHGFGLVLLDLADDRPGSASWIRLARRAAASNTALVLLAPERLAGSCAELAVETRSRGPRFEAAPDWLTGLEVRLVLARSRSRPVGDHVDLPLCSEPVPDVA